jgi:hypothetical protein
MKLRKILLGGLVAIAAIAVPMTVAAAPASAAPTMAQRQAIGSAHDYLRYMAFSKQGLIDQLDSKYGEGYSKAVATYAVNHIRVNWYYQAVRSAKSYLRYMHFSRSGLIQQLHSPYGAKFTYGQAVYAANQVGL